jgi:uncharacterized protein
MQPHVSFITLGVPDLAAARSFYVDGLGWRVVLEVEGEIVFVQAGHGLTLALWDPAKITADAGGDPVASPSSSAGDAPMSLAHNVGSADEVVAAVDRAVAAGGTLLKAPQSAEFGGFHGFVADPAGFRWEIAWNPEWSVAGDGTVTMQPPPE